MTQLEIEIILARQLSEYLTLAVFIVDPDGTLMYYNDPAENILGQRFEETGPLPASEWSTIFSPMDENNKLIDPEKLPLMIALTNKKPAHSVFWIFGLDGARRKIAVTALPLTVQADRFLGAIAIFWEPNE